MLNLILGFILFSICVLYLWDLHDSGRNWRCRWTRCPSCDSTQYRKIHPYGDAEMLFCLKCGTKFYGT